MQLITNDEIVSSKLITVLAILGRDTFVPGHYWSLGLPPNRRCMVRPAYANTVPTPDGKTLDVSDCTCFLVTHIGLEEKSPPDVPWLDQLLEESLFAVNELITWKQPRIDPFVMPFVTRQVGRPDVKFFGLLSAKAYWINPRFVYDYSGTNALASAFGMASIAPNPLTHPLNPVTHKLLKCYDLFNGGYYTESFITAFALLDDLVQNVLKAGMAQKGVDSKGQRRLLRAIKEQRLEHFLCDVMPILGGQSLRQNDQLCKRVLGANELRNDIMHGERRLTRQEAKQHVETIKEAIAWLGQNAFGYTIPKPPEFKTIEPTFTLQ